MGAGSPIDAQLGIAEETYQDEVQTVTITGGPTGGTFTLTFDGATTAAIAFDATAAAVQSALEALPNIGTGGVGCAGGPLPGTAVTVTFSGALVKKRNVSMMTAASSLTGGVSPAIAITETTAGKGYGDYVAPTAYTEFLRESLRLDVQKISGGGLRPGRRVQRSDRRVVNKKGAGGELSMEFLNKGMGLWLKHLFHSSTITTPSGGTNTRRHRYVLADGFNKSLSIQVGRPDMLGTVRAFSYVGSKLTQGVFSNDVDQMLALAVTVDAKDEDTGKALGSASYAASAENLSYVGGLVTIASANVDARAPQVTVAPGYKTDRYFVRRSTLKKEPVQRGLTGVNGSCEIEFDSLEQYADFVSGAIVAITFSWRGDLIEGSLYHELLITMPACQYDGETPNVEGDEPLVQRLPFTVLHNGTDEPITVDWFTTDTTD